MTDKCHFCRIGAREIGVDVVYEDDFLMAFLDHFPIRPGHTLIIPKKHYDYFDDMPAELITPTILLGQKLAAAMKALYGVPHVAFLFVGGDLPHAHAHVVPLREYTDITSRQYIVEANVTFRKADRMPAPELAAIARDLADALGAPKSNSATRG
jgi:histidine triad (HIT) family protein